MKSILQSVGGNRVKRRLSFAANVKPPVDDDVPTEISRQQFPAPSMPTGPRDPGGILSSLQPVDTIPSEPAPPVNMGPLIAPGAVGSPQPATNQQPQRSKLSPTTKIVITRDQGMLDCFCCDVDNEWSSTVRLCACGGIVLGVLLIATFIIGFLSGVSEATSATTGLTSTVQVNNSELFSVGPAGELESAFYADREDPNNPATPSSYEDQTSSGA
ncbi:uncharacterized protein LOC135399681 [Ornithodoros turicata]|uniref:uncharacterized protein LOC135399681 n=1 Tax=Ornithodoros turicata TaxID=34597 RepID=UPI00313860CB